MTRTSLISQRTLIGCFVSCVNVFLAGAVAAQGGQLEIEYTVKVADIPGQLFHVTTDIRNIHQPALELSLPVWSPGWYVIENYAKNIYRLRVANPAGRELRPALVRKQTWRIDTRGISGITVEFDYHAAILSANQARIAADYAFFTGTQLFLLPEGHQSRPSKVRFDVPSGWKISSGLDETIDPTVFTAPDYDTLVDQPTLMGQLEVTRFMVDGKPHDLVANPPGVFSPENTRALIGNLTRLAETQGKIFGGLPYRKFVYFYIFRSPEAGAAALEHGNSFATIWKTPPLPQPDDMAGQAAHEYFHLWNVKRIRPVQLWPYDYSREIETPLLWVSEGFTAYYSNLSAYRAGLRNGQTFLDQIAGGIAEIEGNEARRYISSSDASTSAWIGYAAPPPFSMNYYTQGRTLAALLDLSIRHDTLGASGLDDVMRALFTEVYQRGRGFSTEDLIHVINGITRSSYEGFFSRYVSGTDVPPYETVFGYAGYRVQRTTRKIPNAGANMNERGQVTGLPPGYGLEPSRLQPGDIILSIDGQLLDGQPGGTVFRLFAQKAGQNVRLRIQRGGGERELEIPVASLEIVTYRIVDGPSPTPDQLKIRESWLKR